MHLIPSNNISYMDYFEVLPLRKKQENRKQKEVQKEIYSYIILHFYVHSVHLIPFLVPCQKINYFR